MALRDVKCLALGTRRLHTQVFPKYPDIFYNLQLETFENYQKNIFKPINALRMKEIQDMNRKSPYKSVSIVQDCDQDKDFKDFITN